MQTRFFTPNFIPWDKPIEEGPEACWYEPEAQLVSHQEELSMRIRKPLFGPIHVELIVLPSAPRPRVRFSL